VDFVLRRTAGLQQVPASDATGPRVVSLLGRTMSDARR
jgi:hypothetical protein